MTAPDKKRASTGGNQVEAHQTKKVITGILSTTASAVSFLLAFTFFRGTEQLLVASLGGLLAGGVR